MNSKTGVRNSNNRGSASSEPFAGLALGDYVATVVRGKWRVATVFLIVQAMVILLTLLMKPTYESTVSLLVDTRQSASVLFQDVRTLGMSVDIIQNEMAILSSRALSDAVAEDLIRQKYLDSAKQVLLPVVLPLEDDTLNPDIASVPTVVGRLSRGVTFSSERESYVISVTAASVNPKEAAIIANTYAAAYLNRNVLASRAKSRSFREFLGGQLQEKRGTLKQKEDSLQQYMQRRGVVSIDEETKQLMEQMATLEAGRDANDIEIRSLLSTLASYKGQIDKQEKSIAKTIGEASDPYIRMLQDQLAQLEVERDITISKNLATASQSVNTDRIKEIDNQITDLRDKLQKRTEDYIGNLQPSAQQGGVPGDPTGYLKEIKQKFIETQITIQSLQSKRDALNEALGQYERQSQRVPAKSIEYARLIREKTSLEALYMLLEGKYNEANVTEESEVGYVEVIDPAFIPLEPSSPNLTLNIVLGIVLGLGLGLAYIFVREFVGEKLYSPEDLVRRGFVPLSIIGKFDEKEKASGEKGAPTGREYGYRVSFTNPSSATTEAFRHLRTNLLATNHGVAPKSIMVTSSDPGEGKTTVACNLAVIFAQGGRKVLLVDADMREPAAHIAFGLDSKTGLAQILSGKSGSDPLIRETKVANLHVLCAGLSARNAAELLESPDMKFFVSQVSERYDVVIFDSPPVLAVSDPLILSTLVEAVIVVVSAGHTTHSALKRTTDMLIHVETKMIGVVLNNFDARQAYGYSSTASGYGYYGYAERYGTNGEGKQQKGAKAPAST